MSASTPFAIGVSPTGARRTRADHPALPLSPAEIAETAARCLEAGACMLHLHVRKPDLTHSLEPEDYLPALDAVQKAVGKSMVLQITTETQGQYSPAHQMRLVKALRPEAASIALREIAASEEDLPGVASFFAWMRREHVVSQFILYSTADVEHYLRLRKRSVIPEDSHWVLFVLGHYGAEQPSQPSNLLPFLGAWGASEVPWAVCAFGQNEARCATAALTLGGHARVGFENNLLLPNGELASGNHQLIEVVAQVARVLGRVPADADTLRSWFE